MTSAGPAPDRIPRTLERLARSAWPECRVRAAEPLAGDASARRYVRLRIEGLGAPSSAVVMILPPADAGRSEELAPEGPTSAELPFVSVQRMLSARGVPVPGIPAIAMDDGLLLLEDVGDVPLAEVATGPDGPRLLHEAAALLARLSAQVRRPDPGCPAFAQVYDRELVGRELEVVATHGFAPLPGGPARRPGDDPALDDALARLGDEIADLPLVLMHRDYHAWNLHLAPDGRLVVIDFQDALIGPALYDLASLCTDRDSDRFVDPVLERDLVATYAGALRDAGGPDLGGGDALARAWFAAVAYRTLRVIGRFGFLAIEKDKPGYLRFLPRMARQTRRALLERGDRELLELLAERNEAFA